MSQKFNKQPIPCEPKAKTTIQGASVDASIADILSTINNCNGLNTISSCSGMKFDHCDIPSSPYLSFLRKGAGAGKFGLNFNPNNISPEDIELYNTIRNAGWFAELGTAYFHNSVAARTIPILPEWRLTGKKMKQEKTPVEQDIKESVDIFGQKIVSIPDELKIKRWYQLAYALADKYCSPNKTIIENMFLYGDNPAKAKERSERWDRTHGELTDEDQVPDEKLKKWHDLVEGIH